MWWDVMVQSHGLGRECYVCGGKDGSLSRWHCLHEHMQPPYAHFFMCELGLQSIYILGPLWSWNRMVFVKHLGQCLPTEYYSSYTYFGIQERWVTPALWSTALFVSFRIEGADGSGLKILWSLTWEENGHLTWSLCCLRGPQVSIPMAFWQICSALSSNEPPSKEGPQPLIVSFFEGKSKHWERERNPLLIVGLIEPVCRGELGQKPGDSGLSCSATWEEAWSSSQSRIWPLEPDMPNYAPHLATSESLQCILPQFPHQ